MEPLVMIGKAGLTAAVIAAAKAEFADRELFKVRFIGFKDEKRELSAEFASSCGAQLVRITGNVAVFYRQNPDPKKRVIVLPE
jgi:RNA-binding protein